MVQSPPPPSYGVGRFAGLPQAPPLPSGGQEPPRAGPGANRRANGFAVAALILAFVPCNTLSVIFGIIALVQIGTTGQKGRGMAIGALAVTGGWVLIGVVAVAVSLAVGPG